MGQSRGDALGLRAGSGLLGWLVSRGRSLRRRCPLAVVIDDDDLRPNGGSVAEGQRQCPGLLRSPFPDEFLCCPSSRKRFNCIEDMGQMRSCSTDDPVVAALQEDVVHSLLLDYAVALRFLFLLPLPLLSVQFVPGHAKQAANNVRKASAIGSLSRPLHHRAPRAPWPPDTLFAIHRPRCSTETRSHMSVAPSSHQL